MFLHSQPNRGKSTDVKKSEAKRKKGHMSQNKLDKNIKNPKTYITLIGRCVLEMSEQEASSDQGRGDKTRKTLHKMKHFIQIFTSDFVLKFLH